MQFLYQGTKVYVETIFHTLLFVIFLQVELMWCDAVTSSLRGIQGAIITIRIHYKLGIYQRVLAPDKFVAVQCGVFFLMMVVSTTYLLA